MKHFMLLFALCALLLSSSGYSQPMIDGLKIPESGYMQVIETKDGGMLIGRIVSIGVDVVQVETNFGKTEMPIRAIKKIRRIPASSMRDGQHWYPDLNTTRLFLTTTAQMLERGHGYYSNRYLFFSMLAYGVTDHFTLGAGGLTLPIPLKDIPFYITPKVGLLNQESLDLALGALIMGCLMMVMTMVSRRAFYME